MLNGRRQSCRDQPQIQWANLLSNKFKNCFSGFPSEFQKTDWHQNKKELANLLNKKYGVSQTKHVANLAGTKTISGELAG
jgi:hypothetical protein